MDTKFIQQYGEDILCYRLRTARQKKRMQYEDFDKQLIQIHREQKSLYQQKWNLGGEPLIPPVQRGWKRFFVLREDVARSKQAEFFENILKKINTEDRSYRKDFKVKKRRFGRKTYVVKDQQLLKPYEYHFNKLGFTDAEKQLFHPEYSYEKARGAFIKHFVFNEPWRFVLRTRPNMIDEKRKVDHELESRLQQMHNYLERNDYRKRLSKIVHGYYKYRHWRKEEIEKEKYAFKNKALHTILDVTKDEVL